MIRIAFNILQTSDIKYSATIDVPDQRANGIPVTSIEFNNDTLSVKSNAIGVIYEGVLDSKEMLINGQKQNIKISGVIRPYDISPDNTVNSNQLANLKILYIKDGEENDALEKPWGTKIIESIWPF